MGGGMLWRNHFGIPRHAQKCVRDVEHVYVDNVLRRGPGNVIASPNFEGPRDQEIMIAMKGKQMSDHITVPIKGSLQITQLIVVNMSSKVLIQWVCYVVRELREVGSTSGFFAVFTHPLDRFYSGFLWYNLTDKLQFTAS